MGRPPKCCCNGIIAYACHAHCDTGVGEGTVTRFDPERGTKRWTLDLGTEPNTSLRRTAKSVCINARGDGIVYWDNFFGEFHRLWNTNGEPSIPAFGDYRNGVAKFDKSGAIDWIVELGDPVPSQVWPTTLTSTAEDSVRIRLDGAGNAWVLNFPDSYPDALSANLLYRIESDGTVSEYTVADIGFAEAGYPYRRWAGFDIDGRDNLWTSAFVIGGNNTQGVVSLDLDSFDLRHLVQSSPISNIGEVNAIAASSTQVEDVYFGIAPWDVAIYDLEGVCPIPAGVNQSNNIFYKLSDDWQTKSGNYVAREWRGSVCTFGEDIWVRQEGFYGPQRIVAGTSAGYYHFHRGQIGTGSPVPPDTEFDPGPFYNLFKLETGGTAVWRNRISVDTDDAASILGMDIDEPSGLGVAGLWNGTHSPLTNRDLAKVFSLGTGNTTQSIAIGEFTGWSRGAASGSAPVSGVAIRSL